MGTCAICGKTHGLFTLDLETDEGEAYKKFVCGSCWEVIAAIAVRACTSRFALKDHSHAEEDDTPGSFGTHQYHDIG